MCVPVGEGKKPLAVRLRPARLGLGRGGEEGFMEVADVYVCMAGWCVFSIYTLMDTGYTYHSVVLGGIHSR